jgi:hypothetical protein
MKAIAQERRRFGYRRVHVLLNGRASWSITSGCSGFIVKNG